MRKYIWLNTVFKNVIRVLIRSNVDNTPIRSIYGVVFTFSVIMLVLSFCLSVNFFPSKISQQLLGLGF